MIKQKLNRRMKTIGNNMGFSLTELIIAISILVVVALTCGMLMSTGTDLFSRTNSREQNQYRSQLALAQIKEYCSSCVGIAFDDENNELDIVYREKDGTDKLFRFIYEPGTGYKNNKIMVYEDEYLVAGNEVTIPRTGTTESVQPLINGVKSFKATINSSETGTADSVNLTLTVSNDRKEYTKSYIVALRTKPKYVVNASGSDTYKYQTLVKTVEAAKASPAA